MSLESRAELSFYKEIGIINEPHKIYAVQHINTKKIYVKKILDVYNESVFSILKTHPITNMPHIYCLHEENDQLTVIEEYISGFTIQELLDNGKHFDLSEITSILISICHTLSVLHSFNPAIIHRDIKPSNIMLTPENHVFVLDMNAAKFTNTSQACDTVLIGTNGYAAPEQYGFRSSDAKTDVYAVGMLIKALLASLLDKRSYAVKHLESIAQKCTMLEPNSRYHSVSELTDQLTQISIINNSNSSAIKKAQRNEFLPPGFRSCKISHMIIATPIYLLFLSTGLTLELKSSKNLADLWLNRFFFVAIFLMEIALFCNYLGLQGRLPFLKDNHHRHAPILFVYSFVILFVSMFTLVFIETILFR